MEFKFDPKQPYQQEAIASVVDLFEGQPVDADTLETKLEGALPTPGGQQALEQQRRLGEAARRPHRVVAEAPGGG